MNKIGTWKFKEKYVDCKISLLDSVNFFLMQESAAWI